MKKFKEDSIKTDKVNRGLCSTCNNAPTCLFYQENGSRLVWYCETFDDYVPVRESIPKPEKMIEPKADDPGKRVFEGLCLNCTQNATCTFHKPDGGIWHCEEYE